MRYSEKNSRSDDRSCLIALNYDDTGLHLQSINSAHVSLVEWRISSDGFEKFSMDDSNSISLYIKEWSPWILRNLKGQTGAILKIDYSSNGKYLASCGEAVPDPSYIMNRMEDDKENSSLYANQSHPAKRLTRRQKKNRKRDDSCHVHMVPTRNFVNSKHATNRPEFERPVIVSANTNLRRLRAPTVDGRVISQQELGCRLYLMTLTLEMMFELGYPFCVQDNRAKNSVYFHHTPYNKHTCPRPPSTFNLNAQEFVPRGQSSPSSSSSGNSSESESYSCPPRTPDLFRPITNVGMERVCVRCSNGFFITKTDYFSQEMCTYHWGKVHSHTRYNTESGCYYNVGEYTCCGGAADSPGCEQSRVHVWSGVFEGTNGPCEGYVRPGNLVTKSYQAANLGVYALDCEMSFTVAGLELTKVTVVGLDGALVYDSYVKPANAIVDFNTKFSGITSADLRGDHVKTLKQVQKDLTKFIFAETILVGHGLENDLRALKLVHDRCIDTAVLYPHANGLPLKRSLRVLARHVLKMEIQDGCHDSYEDACVAMELLLAYVERSDK